MKDWYSPRGYVHFDAPLSKASASKIVLDPHAVARNAFYPFLRYIAISQKVSLDQVSRRVVKRDPKEREISYASHRDAHIYSYYSFLLNSAYEALATRESWGASVLAFRALGKCNIQFANDAFMDIRSRGRCCAIGLDIKGFFDNLDHVLLKRAWSEVLGVTVLPDDHFAVFRSLSRYAFAMRDDVYDALGVSKANPKSVGVRLCSAEVFRTSVRSARLVQTNISGKGIPQGSPISAMLSNIYMIEFDRALRAFTDARGGSYYRYCDDILLIVPPAERTSTLSFVSSLILERNLEIQNKKTEIREFIPSVQGLRSAKPLQYLGFLFDGERIFLRSSSLARYQERVNKGLWLAKATMDRVNALRIARGQLPRAVYLKKLYRRYSYLGRRNFLSYSYRAAKLMGSASIRKQVKPHWQRLREKIDHIS